VTYDDNVIDLRYDGADHFVDNIVTRVDGNTLIVDTEGSFRPPAEPADSSR
jgi:hypothetical protein